MSEISLNTLRPGQRARITKLVALPSAVRQRLLEMGLTKGSAVEFVRSAPMGDPIEVKVKGYRLSLRREEAASVMVIRGN